MISTRQYDETSSLPCDTPDRDAPENIEIVGPAERCDQRYVMGHWLLVTSQ
jgi:hypothetical protein